MDNNNIQGNMPINDVGNIARILDTEMTVLERMKIKKSTLLRMVGAIVVYLTMMSIFSIFL
jgi:hypothetical protein